MNKQIITRKDLSYWLIIVSSWLILVLTDKFHANGKVTEFIGFAGTLVSIVLGLIAIVYTFFQGHSFSSVNAQISSAGDAIASVVERLENTSTDTDNKTKAIIERYDKYVESLTSVMDEKFEKTQAHISSRIDALMVAQESLRKPEKNEDLTETFVNDFLTRSSIIGRYVIYAIIQLKNRELEINMKDFLNNAFGNMGGYAHGYYVCTSAIGLCDDIEAEGKLVKITEVNTNIERLLNSYLKGHKKETDEKYRGQIQKAIEAEDIPF